ncbi:MAG: hypothetical protein JSV76_07105 [Candidatus Bathyarchaeota archaeon]|nr:MAG: hypothetical protein JSV76_07105 [Candidatus Bathyarchaeota archaeon]
MSDVISRLRRNIFIFKRPAKYDEYKSNLEYALINGYRVISLEEWFTTDKENKTKTLILRHDVDHDPSSALKICEIEYILGVSSTYYFRWSTLDKDIVQKVINNGGKVGLHYETISRYAIENDLVSNNQITEKVFSTCLVELKEEISIFKRITEQKELSICAHGNSRNAMIRIVNNHFFKQGINEKIYEELGVIFDASDRSIMDPIDIWISDRSGFYESWKDGKSLKEAVDEGNRVILFNCHPQHWTDQKKSMTIRGLSQVVFFFTHPRIATEVGADVFAFRKFRKGIRSCRNY